MNGKAVWVEGARVPAGLRAADAYSRLEDVRRKSGGVLRPADVVEDARPEGSLLHPAFEWDDSVAAELHRQDQARSLIRSVRVVITERETEGPRRTYVHVELNDSPAYVTTAQALSDRDLRDQILRKAKADLTSFRSRYRDLNELSEIFQAIDHVLAQEPAAATV